jgi:hypothetical protein
MSAAWHFVRHQDGQPIVNPLGSEHFADTDEDWQPGEVLVRECIQNSLDAGRDDEVCVVFQVREGDSMSAQTASFWFSSLWPHLLSKDCKLPTIASTPPSGGYVIVEDFGTCGLEGDVRQGGLSDSDNRFFNFFRAEGLSGNPLLGTSGGSWGVGKSVFNRCSRINTFLALTGRRAEGDAALIGKSLLRHHRAADGNQYQYLGQYGCREGEYLVLPAVSPELIQRFVRDFGLSRPIEGPRAEPGLSVVIPYADQQITAQGIVEIVIREYFHPILSGRLRVRVTGRFGRGEETVDLDRESLLVRAERLKKPALIQVLQLAQWSLVEGPRQAYDVSEPPAGDGPQWSDDLLRRDDPRFRDLCERFDRGQPIAVHIPLRVQRVELGVEQPAERAAFTVYLQRDLNGQGYRPVFVRGHIVVPNARQRSVRNQSLFALVTIEEGPLAVMLRAAEPPAHTEWSADTGNFRGRYKHGQQTIDFVVKAPKFLAEALANTRTERDLDVWADLFPSPDEGGDRSAEGRSRRGRRRPALPVEPPQPRPKPFRIEEIEGGFAVVRDNAATTPRPDTLVIRVAYDISHGNPFRKYDPADFRLQELDRRVAGANVADCADNRAVVRPVSDDFRIQFTGFDPNRDLVVKVRTSEAAEEGEA